MSECAFLWPKIDYYFTNIIYSLDFDSKAPVSILDFPTYVAHMHQNADFLFSEEFAVSPCFGHEYKSLYDLSYSMLSLSKLQLELPH